MRKIIFLDFDGVLHPDGVGLFSQLGVFEEYLSQMPDVEVVVSSTWREEQTLDELRKYFSPFAQDRIIGTTPSLEDGYDCGGRQREIQAFLDSAGLNSNNCFWIALDDMPLFFEDDYPNLLLTDSSQGFTASNGHSLLEWYKCTL
jgi:hypothetical protein